VADPAALSECLDERKRERYAREFGAWSRFIPHSPTAKQADALRLYDCPEVFYGGAAGGGKSDWLLMCALQYVDVLQYSALLLRRTYTDLSLPGALMDRAHEWLQGTAAKWAAQDRCWKFPGGATLTFGHLDNENDKYRYQSSEFQFIGFDEVTQFDETQYLYLFSRLRRLAGSAVPARMRAASNPDGGGFDWVKKRFITDALISGAKYVPAKLEDNPHLDQAQYESSLEKIALGDALTYQRLREGSWEERQGTEIRREWFEHVAQLPESTQEQCRAVDTAWTKKKQGNDPDYFASIGGAMANGWLYLLEPHRARMEMPDAVDWIKNEKKLKPRVRFGMAQAAGEKIAKQFLERLGIPIEDLAAETTDLRSRLVPFVSFASRGLVKLVGSKEMWSQFLEEATAFPNGKHDDLLAACAGLTQMHGLRIAPPAQPKRQTHDAALTRALRDVWVQ
jgi:phage terminase large subunit-like protein